MTCYDLRKHSRSKPSFLCADPDDRCRYFGQLVNEGEHQYEHGECIVCGATPPAAASGTDTREGEAS